MVLGIGAAGSPHPLGRYGSQALPSCVTADIPIPSLGARQHPVEDLPADVLVFLLGSRYCETDRLSEIAWQLFGHSPMGWGRVQAICDFCHNHIAFNYADACPT